MDFILPFNIKPSEDKISYGQKIFFIGSCFTEEIGNHFNKLKFDVLQNPNGILYDPRSIAYAITLYVQNKQYRRQDLFLHDELWHSWQHHSVFSGMNKDDVIANINTSQSAGHSFIQKASWLIITLGTSYSYRLKSNGEFVANCHKAPSSFFDKMLTPLEEIELQISSAIKDVQLFNPNLKIIFTISPVRHIGDGIIENSRSKARLIEAVHSIIEKNKNVFYFPAYELVIDVLRDYRFYKEDMVHANETAVNYVFESFCKTLLSEDAKKLVTELKTLLSAMNHKPFQKESAAHKKFLETQLEKAKNIKGLNPDIDLSKEINYFSGMPA